VKATKRLNGLVEYRTIAGWAEVFGVAPHTLETWVRAHCVKVTKLGGTPLLTIDDLDGYKARIGAVRRLLETGE
jgi:hypothetical protein